MKRLYACGKECDPLQDCELCHEYVCDECWPEHERYCRPYPRYPDTDIFGYCYSDADPNL